MNFETLFRNLLQWNINAWSTVFRIFSEIKSRDAAYICELAKAGIKQNHAILQLFEQMTFMPGDEESAEAEAAFFNQGLERKEVVPAPQQGPQGRHTVDKDRDKEIAELERIMLLESDRIRKLDPNWYTDFLKREQDFDTDIKTSSNGSDQGSISGDKTEGPGKPEIQGE